MDNEQDANGEAFFKERVPRMRQVVGGVITDVYVERHLVETRYGDGTATITSTAECVTIELEDGQRFSVAKGRGEWNEGELVVYMVPTPDQIVSGEIDAEV